MKPTETMEESTLFYRGLLVEVAGLFLGSESENNDQEKEENETLSNPTRRFAWRMTTKSMID